MLKTIPALICLLLATAASATPFYWDADGSGSGTGGTGTWDATTSLWRNTTALGTLSAWPNTAVNTDAAVFTNTAGTVTLNSSSTTINVNSMIFTNTTGTCVIAPPASGSATLNFSGTAPSINQTTVGANITAVISGSVPLTRKSTTGSLIIAGNNSAFSGGLTNITTTGTLIISNANSLGSGQLTMKQNAGGTTAGLRLAGGITVANTIVIDTATGRQNIDSIGGNNTLSGPITILGTTSSALIMANNDTANAGTTFTINNSIATTANFPNSLSMRPTLGNFIQLSGVVNLASTATLNINGAGTLIISATGNNWGNVNLNGGFGTLKCGAANCLYSGSRVSANGGATNTLDLAGFDQTVAGLDSITNNSLFITNGSATSDVTLTLNPAANLGTSGNAGTAFGFGGIIADGVHKLNLTLTGGTQTLTNANTYGGSTTISGGTLALVAAGSISNSVKLAIAAGAVFDVSGISAYTNFNATVTASGAGTGVGSTAATIVGGTSVNLGAKPIILNYTPASSAGDLTSPALYISQGSLALSGQITITNLGSPLGAGTYTLIQTAGGLAAGNPTLNPNIAGNGLAAGTVASLAVSSGAVKLVVSLTGQPATATIVRHAGTGTSSIYGDALQFDVTVSPAVASGLVTVRDGGFGGNDLGTGTLPGGSPNTVTVTVTALNVLTAGAHTNIVAVYGGDSTYSGTNSVALSVQTVAPKNLTVTGATGGNKAYNGTTAATFTGNLNGVVSGDTSSDVFLAGAGTFANAGPGTGIAITPAGTLGGGKAADYTLTQPAGLTGDILSAAVWNTTAYGENWSTASDWVDNAIGDGAGAIVDFSQVDITSTTLVHLDSPRTMRTLIFGDTDTSSPATWILDNNGVAGNSLTLSGNTPGIAVNAGSGATIETVVTGTGGLTKTGNGTLILATNNTWSGGTTIAAGTLQIGADTTLPIGNLGSGNITNNGTLSFNRVGGLLITNYMTGTGRFVQACTNALTVVGTNTYSGGTTVASFGAVIISNAYSLGSGPVNLQSLQTGANATFQVSDGMNLTNAINIDATTGREMISATNGNNTLSGPMVITGAANPAFVFQNVAPNNAGTTLAFSNTITAPDFSGSISLRGNVGNFGQLAGMVTAPNMQLNVNGNANWIISAAGNSWSYLSFSTGAANNGGSVSCGAAFCLPTIARVNWASTSSNVLDLAGFSQTIGGLDCTTVTTGAPLVTNSSAANDALLTINTGGNAYTFAGSIKDGVAHKIALTLTGGAQTLKAANTYSGNTTISSGTLTLAATGSINNSTNLAIGAGGTFDVSAISDYTNNGLAFAASGLDTGVGSTAATINGGSTVTLGSQPVTLTYTPTTFTGDASHPALYISQGALALNGQITVNNAGSSPLGTGLYTLISAASGTLTGNPTLRATIGGNGMVAGPDNFAALQVAGGAVNLVVGTFTGSGTATTTTIARSAGVGSSTTYGDAVSFDLTVSPAPNDGDIVAIKDGGAAGATLGYGMLAGGTCTVALPLNVLTAGSHPNIVAVYYGDDSYAGSISTALSTQTVAHKNLTLSGPAASNRPYNGTTSATITGTVNGVISGDTLGIDVYLVGTGTFANAGPGTNITVTSAATLGGGKAANYSLTQPTGLAADIVTAAVWNTVASGEAWSTAADWVENVIGDGAGTTANFNAVNITADPTVVHLDSPRTVQTLVLGDTDTSTAAGWVLDNNGIPANTLTLAGTAPGITVNALAAGRAATVSAVVAGTSGLAKTGTGTLILANNNAYSGGTTIAAGTLQIGAGAASGALGGGRVTNNSVLTVNRSDSVNVTNPITGTGNVTQSGGGVLSLSGVNTYSGGTILAGTGELSITNAFALGTGALNLQSAQATAVPTLQIGGGINITNAINIDASTGREMIFATNGNNTLSGPLVITGATSSTLVVQNSDTINAGTLLTVSGSITGTNFANTFSLRGSAGNFGLLAGTVTAPNMQLNLNGNATWTIASTGNAWSAFSFSAGAANNLGTLVCGAANCLPAGAKVSWAVNSSNVLDLAGFSQTIGGLDCATTTDTPTVTNSSATSDALLTLNAGTNAYTFAGVIRDGATHKIALTSAGGTNTLSGTNAYSGNTTVNGGRLVIQAATLGTNSTVTVAGGAVLQLGFAVTNQVGGLVLNGVSKASGVYNSTTDPVYLAGTGSLLVSSSIANYPTNISFNVSGNTLNLSWPATHLGWYAQSNSVDLVNSNFWFDVPNSQNGTSLIITINPAQPNVFYRLRHP
ncbi:MAG: YDG domain-containing protein [Verrucomicrobiae bacterium]|nr:YDG domain-containing protein [Verrucomicrobiae bacterium]